MDIRETLYRLLTALHATTCDDQRISERRCIVYFQHYTQRHATTNGYQGDVVSFTYSNTRDDMRRGYPLYGYQRDVVSFTYSITSATTCDDQRISERCCIVYLQHYTQRHAKTDGYQRALYRLLTALRATTCDDQRISDVRCIVYLQHYTQRHAKTDGYQRDVVSFTYSITRNQRTCDDQRISERRCIVYLQHYTQRHAKTNGYQRDVVSFTYSITRNDMRRPTDIRDTLYLLLTALHATTCEDRWISERRCIVYLQHYAQRHATTNGYQRDVASFTYSITRNDMRRPTDIRETLYRLLTAICDDQRTSDGRCIVYLQHYTQRHAEDRWISERRCIVYLQHFTQRHATTADIRETLYPLLTALHATACVDQRISERRCIVYLRHYTQRHAKTDGYLVSFTQHYTQRHAKTDGYQLDLVSSTYSITRNDVVSFTYSITRNDMRRPTDIRETLYRLLTALHATTISGRPCIIYLQHYTQRHAKTNGYQRGVVSFTYSITRNDMRRPMDIRETLYRLLTALRATTCDDQRISETLYRLLTALHATTCEDRWISERRCIVYLQHYT